MDKEVQRVLLEHNKKYYEILIGIYPDEPIWEKALSDVKELLKGLEK